MFHPMILKALKNTKFATSFLIYPVLLISLSTIDLAAQYKVSPMIFCSKNLISTKNECLYSNFRKETNSVYTKNINFSDSDSQVDYSKMNISMNSNPISNTNYNFKKEILLLKRNQSDRVRGSRKKLGIYMTVAGVSLIVAALIIHSKNK